MSQAVSPSWSDSLGVPREHRGYPDVGQSQVQHDDPFQPDSNAGVFGTTILEEMQVVVNVVEVEAVGDGTDLEHF